MKFLSFALSSLLRRSVIAGFVLMLAAQSASAAISDRVLVIVNEDVITQSEYDYRMQTVLREIEASGKPAPQDLSKQILDGLVSDRLQVQEANRRGVEINDEQLARAISRYAQQQGLTVAQLQQSIESSGQSFKLFQETVRDSLTVSRFTEYYARSRVVVPEYEIEGFIAANKLDQDNTEYQIARILIQNEDGADSAETARKVRDEIRDGMSFQQAVLTYSSALDAQEGGMLGWRTAAQLPDMFVDALKDLQVGSVSEVIEGPNGFHILKLVDLKGDRQEVVQTQVRHILIKADSRVARSQAVKRMFELRQRVVEGEELSDLARIYSDDSVSAANGGDLGWVSPGETVPQFEETFEKLSIGQLSQPIETQFGVHLLRVEDRRKQNVTDKIIRARADQILRRQRADREFNQWVRELKEGAYIEHVAKPA